MEAGAKPPALDATLFGRFSLRAADGRQIMVSSRRARGILAYLIVEPRHCATREKLAGLFWGDRSEAQARSSLRQSLLELRAALGDSASAVLRATRSEVAVEGVDSDLARLARMNGTTAQGDFRAAIEALDGQGLLDDLELRGDFAEWREQERARLERMLGAAIATRLEALAEAREWNEAVALADAWLRRDPLDEVVIAHALRAELGAGAAAAAKRRYDQFSKLLWKELSIRPGAVIEDAMTAPSVEAGAKAGTIAPPTGAGAQGDAPSLAVLPFINRSGLPEDDVFAVGMVEDLIDALSQGVNLRVLASSATARFHASEGAELAVMARELGVRYVMAGNVRRAGDVLRVTSQLVEAESGAILWTQKFERSLSELAALQEELVLEVAAHLGSQVHQVEMERVLRKPENLTAWECVTRATACFRNIRAETLAQALSEAERAVEIAPDYALGHAIRAYAAATIYMWLHPDSAEKIRRVEDFIDRALDLDPRHPVVLAQVAQSFNYVGQPERALAHAERAIQLRPHYGLAHYAMAVACTMLNRTEDAIRHFDAELKSAPGSHTLFASYDWRASAYVRAGRWDEAEMAYAQAIDINPAAVAGYLGAAFSASFNGRDGDAVRHMAKVRQLQPDMSLGHWVTGMRRWFINCGDIDALIGRMEQLWVDADAHMLDVV